MDKPPRCIVKLTGLVSDCHSETIFTEKEQIIPKPEKGVAQEEKKKKDILEETGGTKIFGPGVNSA